MHIDRQTFWFLDAVIEMGENLAVLKSPRIEEILNRRTHGLGERELVEQIASLCQSGLIEVKNDDGVRVCSLDDVDRAFAESRCEPRHYSGFWYSLTPAGGAAWESVTHPDWSCYLSHWTRREEVCIEAATRERAVEEFNRASTDPAHVPVPGSYRETLLEPWEATYWKTLPSGVRIQYAWTKGGSNVAWQLRQPQAKPWYNVPRL
ncbi:hypothetical protein JY651_46195 [Pyxidicoccus parkwayensis]|uniref:Uncharacterized protein n=1 Tax=Pyxidicoccus parkwayensis TaxID=2813578 RepID=A0ABX7P1J9_9BACT|nr:hypothetical protein [Pyxidicoccus parkwaysis]QSQ22433.1 hypothetical protein JY651_46195 [Pyxidicoccus parkwaysis]